MLIKKNQAITKNNSEKCKVSEYDIKNKSLSAATALINGRYPDKGRATNMKCIEIYYVISGKGIVHSEKGDFKIDAGDVYLFDIKEKYWIEGEQLFVYLSNSPAWYPGQYKIID